MALTDRSQRISNALDTRRIALLAGGDLVAFNLITAIGLASHGELTGLGALGQVVVIAAPFAIGWFAVAPFVGLFKADVACRPRGMLARVALAWLIALPIGLLLWSIIRQKQIQPAFAIVTFITNLIALLGWRGAYALLAARGRGK
jgi:hypothetical protein